MDQRNLPVPTGNQGISHSSSGMSQEYIEPVISPRQVWSMLWAHRTQTLLIAATVIVLTAVAAWLLPRTYEATATLMVNFDVYDPLGDREFPIGLLGSYVATQVDLAGGPAVIRPVIERLKLTEDEDYVAGYSGAPAGLNDWVTERFRKKLTVEQGGYGSQLVYLTYSASTPEDAARVVNTVADVYTEQQHERQTGPAAERARRYAEQIAELKTKVDEAQADVTSFRQRTGLIDSYMVDDNINLQLLTTLEHRLQEIQQTRRVAASKVVAGQAVGRDVLGSTMVQSLKTQLANYSTRMAELRATHGARHPDVMALQSQIRVTRASLAAEERAYAQSDQSELVAAQTLERQLLAAVKEQRIVVADARDLHDEGAKFELELTSAQEVYKRALEGYDQVIFAATGGYSNIDIVNRATPPPSPSQPRVGLMMLLGIFGGFALGVIIPLIRELLNRRIRCRDDVERDHGTPVLAELGRVVAGGPAWETQNDY